MNDESLDPFAQLRSWESADASDASRRAARARLDARIERRPYARRPPRRAVLVLACMAVAAAAGVALAAGFWRTQHTGHLAVYTKSGALDPRFHVGATGAGYCWTDSAATDAQDAFRCMQGNLIHDPCFAARPHTSTVACFIDPWHAVTILHLTRPLPRHTTSTGAFLPWAIETTDGGRCTMLTGATAPMGGERINYGCTDHSYLIGAPDRRHPLWTIRRALAYEPDPPGHPTPIESFPLAKIARTVP